MYKLLLFLAFFTSLALAPIRAVCIGGAWLFCHLNPWDLDHWFLMKLKPYLNGAPHDHWLRKAYEVMEGRLVLSREIQGPEDKFYSPKEYIEKLTDENTTLEIQLRQALFDLNISVLNEKASVELLLKSIGEMKKIESELRHLDTMYGPHDSYETLFPSKTDMFFSALSDMSDSEEDYDKLIWAMDVMPYLSSSHEKLLSMIESFDTEHSEGSS